MKEPLNGSKPTSSTTFTVVFGASVEVRVIVASYQRASPGQPVMPVNVVAVAPV